MIESKIRLSPVLAHYSKSGRWPWRRKQFFDYVVDLLTEQKGTGGNGEKDNDPPATSCYEADDEGTDIDLDAVSAGYTWT